MKRRKWLSVILTVCMLGVQAPFVSANSNIKVTFNNAKQVVPTAKVKLDGKVVPLEAPAYITNSRIVVPVRFLAESTGAIVKWDDSQKRVHISTLNKEIDLWIDKNVMEVNGEKIKLDEGSIPRLTRYEKEGDRAVVPLRAIGEAMGYKVGFENGTGTLEKQAEAEVKTTSPSGTSGNGESTFLKATKPGSTIEKAELMVVNGKIVLRMNGITGKKVKVFKLDNPNRVIYDVYDTVFAPGKWEFLPISYDNIEKIRIAQFQGNGDGNEEITRIVFEVVRISDIDELLYFYEDGSLQIDIRSIESMTKEKIEDTKIASQNPNKTQGSNNTTIIESTNDSDRAERERQQEADYQAIIARRLEQAKLLALPSGAQNTQNQYVHIMIDPGHGGRDPGTISFNGRYEKDFALAASLKLRDDLRKMGFVVHMTRETDRYPTLMERAMMANTLKADIFVSMHANSVDPNRGPNGIEVWYSGVGKDGTYTALEKQLASRIDQKLIEVTSAVDRGIKKAKHVVTKNSKMAAILIEAGFLSNPVEEALLFNEHYRDVVARATAVAIHEFVESNRTALAASKKSMIAAETVVPKLPSTDGKKVKYKVNADALNVRKNPGLSEATIGKVYEGEILTVEFGVEEIKKDGYTWLYTTDNSGNLAGWLAKEFLIEQQ